MSNLRQNLDFIAELLQQAGVVSWAVSPGSRNAPIVAGMLRRGDFKLHSFPDERCAGFAALGMSLAEKYPAGVICTSGTAVLNLYPAICEAFYQRVPMLVITADRPKELIDQWDGQTIHQKDIFEKHILASYEVPDLDDDFSMPELETLIYEAVNIACGPIPGPVHINIPLRDPIYSGIEEEFEFHSDLPDFIPFVSEKKIPDFSVLKSDLSQYNKILLLFGQEVPNIHVENAVRNLQNAFPVFADVCSNLQTFSVKNWECALSGSQVPEEFEPDLVISFGLSITSKSLKKYLQGLEFEHWHISPAGFVGDPFQSNPRIIRNDPALFLESLIECGNESHQNYCNLWKQHCMKTDTENPIFLKKQFLNEFLNVKHILHLTGKEHALHLANSMTVRYAGWAGNSTSEIYCNRGTSGIDGTMSTAIGYALKRPEQKVICVTGDIGFFYDANALWTTLIPNNLRIIINNNFGGKIFEFIEGPNRIKELKPFVQTNHKMTASLIAAQYGLTYLSFQNSITNEAIEDFLNLPSAAILEIIYPEK